MVSWQWINNTWITCSRVMEFFKHLSVFGLPGSFQYSYLHENTPKSKKKKGNSWICNIVTTEPTNLVSAALRDTKSSNYLVYLMMPFQLSFTSKENDYWAVTEILWATNYVHTWSLILSQPDLRYSCEKAAGGYVALHNQERIFLSACESNNALM